MSFEIERRFRINHRITAAEVRLVGEGTNEVIPTHEAIKRALDQKLDLVEVGPNAKPPVVKITDFKKFVYQETKKEQKKSKTHSKLKEIRLSPIIAQNDFENKVRRGTEFLKNGDQLRVNVLIRGRLTTHPELAQKKMVDALKILEPAGKLVSPPKWQGRNLLAATLAPK
ncbi:MAG: translation initiation factor IF-3 [Patescibacteria group bacterium]|nr:translation initiation factor IF-3 [Patescibacteria group bacterium]